MSRILRFPKNTRVQVRTGAMAHTKIFNGYQAPVLIMVSGFANSKMSPLIEKSLTRHLSYENLKGLITYFRRILIHSSE